MSRIPRHYFYRLIDSVAEPKLLLLRRQGVILGLYRDLDRRWLHDLRIRTVLDIGANVGRFAVTARALFPEAHIYAFDPLEDCLEDASKAMGGDRAFTPINVALGDSPGSAIFQRNAASGSSSLLQITRRHVDAYPGTDATREVTVEVDTLDRVATRLTLALPMLVKMDVQGFESQVLHGGKNTISQASVVLLETSFETLYDGQALFAELYESLTTWGFEFRGNLDQAYDRRDGRLLQADSLFVKRGILA